MSNLTVPLLLIYLLVGYGIVLVRIRSLNLQRGRLNSSRGGCSSRVGGLIFIMF